MAKQRKVFVCSECDAQHPAWAGRCTGCGGWATVEEHSRQQGSGASAGARRGPAVELVPLKDISTDASVPLPTGVTEVDRVLGGGFVPGSVTLISGEPGIGKSTLTLQVALSVAGSGASVVVVTGEEAPAQVAARAHRTGAVPEALRVLDQTSFAAIAAAIGEHRPQLVIIDSIQTLTVDEVDGAPGSVSQVREIAGRLVALAKANDVSVVIVGHVTKDGGLAGPRLLEHVVDTVLSFSGDRTSELRTLRSVKHRFGPTSEVGVFEMTAKGLESVLDPSERFLCDRAIGTPGSVVAPLLDGNRPVMVEVQALVTGRGETSAQIGAQGLSSSRVRLVMAVLEQRAGLSLSNVDVFTSLAGGVKSEDPGLDLAIAIALASAASDTPVDRSVAVCGELGLAGEVRSPMQFERRLHEAFRLGFRRAIVGPNSPSPPTGLEVLRCRTVAEALSGVLGLDSRAKGS